MITSSNNQRIQLARGLLHDRKTREEKKQWCLEGVRLIEEGLDAGISIAFVLYSPQRLTGQRGTQLLKRISRAQIPCEPTNEHVLQTLSDTVTTQGILAVAVWPQVVRHNSGGLLLVLDGVADPGNVGTILRTARAANCDGVVLAPGSVDIFNPKVVRSAMGAQLYLPIETTTSWETIQKLLADRSVWIAEAQKGTAYDAVNWTEPSALILGNEASGPSSTARELAHGIVTIPLHKTESLNVAVATGVFCFEFTRQKRLATTGKTSPAEI